MQKHQDYHILQQTDILPVGIYKDIQSLFLFV